MHATFSNCRACLAIPASEAEASDGVAAMSRGKEKIDSQSQYDQQSSSSKTVS